MKSEMIKEQLAQTAEPSYICNYILNKRHVKDIIQNQSLKTSYIIKDIFRC